MKQISFLLAVLICFAGFAQTEQLPDTILVQGLNEVVEKSHKSKGKTELWSLTCRELSRTSR